MIPVISKLANISSASIVDDLRATAEGVSAVVRTVEIYVPLEGKVDISEELSKLESELEYQKNFLASVRRKLENENFVAHAPAKVIEGERKKESDALSRIESYESRIKELKTVK
jgi:valyl-tRNA synthetase